MDFQKLTAPSLTELFVRQLQDKIFSEELPIGAKLPPERELAAAMHVSRAVVNGGIAELAKQGFLEVRPRQGTFVADYRRNGNIGTLVAIMEYQGSSLGRSEIRSILEIRWALEHLALKKAIDNASDEEIAALGSLLDALAKADTPESAALAAFAFQHQLAFLGKNNVLPLIYGSFKTPVITLWERFCRLHGIPALYRNTKKLYGFLAARDLEGASAWIDTYLPQAIDGPQQVYGDAPGGPDR